MSGEEERGRARGGSETVSRGLFLGGLLSKFILGTGLIIQWYVLPHRDTSCTSTLLSHPVKCTDIGPTCPSTDP